MINSIGQYKIEGLGWIPDYPDHRDLSLYYDTPLLNDILPSTTMNMGKSDNKLPSSVDLRKDSSPIENQEHLGSCTAQAIASILEYNYKVNYDEYIDVSRLFLYKVTRDLLGWKGDTGAFIRTTMKALRLYGVCPENIWPYQISRFDDEPSIQAYILALNYKSIKYYKINTLDEMKKSLSKGIPFACGFMVFSNDQTPESRESGMITLPKNKNDKPVGGHAVGVFGYDDSKGCFIFKNSWGPNWGEDGYGYLPYEYFEKNLAMDAWCLLDTNYITF